MKKVQVRDEVIYAGDNRIPFLAGEVHYWRLAPPRWEKILTEVKALGLDMIATYVPWEYHELAPGKYDFTGSTEPQRNLVGFLELAQKMGFWIFIRPGPYIYSEWVNAGVPEYAARHHRLSEEFLSAAQPWIKSVTEVLKPFFFTNGGRIVAFQVDNEMDPFLHWYEEQFGLEGPFGLFHEFLEQRYGDIDALNAAWRTDYESFLECRSSAEPANSTDPAAKARSLDWWRFSHWAVTRGLEKTAEMYRAEGVDIPLVANYYAGLDCQHWPQMANVVDFLGIDVYPPYRFKGDMREFRRFVQTLRYQESFSSLPSIIEFQCGIWHGYHEHVGILKADHYRLIGLTALLAGIAGWNWYMIVNRDNWYMCPIQEWGRVRGDLAPTFKTLVDVFNRLDPPSLERITTSAATIDVLGIAAEDHWKTSPVINALAAADVDHQFFDLEEPACKPQLLFYTGGDWLSERGQTHLLEYVEGGGHLVFFKTVPRFDDALRPLNLLDLPEPSRVLSRLGKDVLVKLGEHAARAKGSLFVFDEVEGEAIEATQQLGAQQAVECSEVWPTLYEGKTWTIGFSEELGSGRVTYLGVDPSPELIVALHKWAGVAIPSRAHSDGILTALFRRGDSIYLIAVNPTDAAKSVPVAIDPDCLTPPASGTLRARDLWNDAEVELALAQGTLYLDLPATGGGVWQLSGF
jgi:hypothetical protein